MEQAINFHGSLRETLTFKTRRACSFKLQRRSNDNLANQLNPDNVKFWRSRHRGSRVFFLMPSCQEKIGKLWNSSVQHAVLGDNSFILMYDGGRYACKDIPARLHERIQQEGSKLSYVALGPDKASYFVRFHDGSASWTVTLRLELSKKIHEVCETSRSNVSVVAFAPNNGYFVLFENGSWQCNGLPDDLVEFSKEDLERIVQIDHMIVSANSEWFVSFKDGKRPRWRCGALPSSASSWLFRVHGDDSVSVRSVELAASGCWLIRYNDKN